jgi:hypothetical protein
MIFTDEDVRKYQGLCRKYFGEEIDYRTAAQEMSALVHMVALIYRPSLRLDLEKLDQSKREQSPGRNAGSEPRSDA